MLGANIFNVDISYLAGLCGVGGARGRDVLRVAAQDVAGGEIFHHHVEPPRPLRPGDAHPQLPGAGPHQLREVPGLRVPRLPAPIRGEDCGHVTALHQSQLTWRSHKRGRRTRRTSW